MGLNFTDTPSTEGSNQLIPPTNAFIADIFSDTDKVVIKNDGVYNGKAMSDEVVLVLDNNADIKKLQHLLAIDEVNTGFYCMCLGTYAIELYTNGDIKNTIGFHHNVSLRHHLWNSDANLTTNHELLLFFAALGFPTPLRDWEQATINTQAYKIAERNWRNIAPRSFQNYWDRFSFDSPSEFIPLMLQDLAVEIPDKDKLIVSLLQLFGVTSNFWDAYPDYEEIPQLLLDTFPFEDILLAYERSDRNYKTRRGLGRYLGSFKFRKKTKKYIKLISTTVLDDIEKCFKLIDEEAGIRKMNLLRRAQGEK